MSETTELPSPRLVALDFAEDINRLTDEFVGREWIFTEIAQWIREGNEPFFILTGEPGIGKSAIAARLTQVRDDIAAYHFCIAGRNSTIVPGTVLRSIAAQLGRKLLDYGLALANTIKLTYLSVNVKIDVGTMSGGQITGVVINNLTITDAKQEIETLLTAPLSAMPAPAQPVLILLDSLDEAFNYSPNENLVTLLAGLHNLPRWVRIILTSRPEARVLSYFGFLPTHVVAAESQMNREDLRRYVGYRISKSKLFTRLQAAPTPITAEALVEKVAGVSEASGLADGNFLYTKILLNDIESGVQPLDDLAALPKSLDDIDQGFLLRLAPEWETKYQPLLAVLAVAREPLTCEQLLRFGDQSPRLIGGRMTATLVNLALGVLMQFLDSHGEPGQEHYALFHKSLRDYLGNPSRSGHFACLSEDGHHAIAEYYLELVGNDWGKCDLYGLKHLTAHLAEADCYQDLYTLYFDYRWLQAKLARLDVYALLTDFNQNHGEAEIQRVSEALRQAAHVLVRDPEQLASQLHGRLCDDSNPEIQLLLAQAIRNQVKPWLRPLTTSLRESSALLHTLEYRTGRIGGVVLSGDGKLAISSSDDWTLKLWDVASGQELHTLKGHTQDISGMAISGDGTVAISASYDKMIVWDVATGKQLRALEGHANMITGVAMSGDGRLAVSASYDKTLKVWDVSSGQVLHTIEVYINLVNGVAMSANGRLIVAFSDAWMFKVWDVASGRELPTLKDRYSAYGYGPKAIAVSEDGRIAISCDPFEIWDVATGRQLRTLEGHTNGINDLAMSGDGNLAVSASSESDGTLKVWDVATGKELCTLEGHTSRVRCVAMSRDGQIVVSTSDDNTLRVWKVASSRALSTFNDKPRVSGMILDLAISEDGRLAISVLYRYYYQTVFKVWDVATGRELRTFQEDTDTSFIKRILRLLRRFNLPVFKGHTGEILSVAMSGDGRLAVSVSYDDQVLKENILYQRLKVKVWDVASGKKLRTFKGPKDTVSGVAMSGDGRLAISKSGDNSLRLWDTTRGKQLRTLRGHTGWVRCVALSGDGRVAVSTAEDNTIRVWDVAAGKELYVLTGRTDWVRDIAVSGDGNICVFAAEDNTLRVWDLTTGQELYSLEGHTDDINNVVISGDGRLIVSASSDKTLRVWEMKKGLCIAALVTDGHMSHSAITPDGITLVAGGDSGRVHFLKLERPTTGD